MCIRKTADVENDEGAFACDCEQSMANDATSAQSQVAMVERDGFDLERSCSDMVWEGCPNFEA
jgi:hypothetical protein